VTALRIKGGPELKARLTAIVGSKPEITHAWADDAAKRIKSAAPRRTGRLAASVMPAEQRGKAVVKGNWYGIILDRGTKAYPITPKRAESLRFEYKGRTIFSKKVLRRRLRRRPFITKGAQDALKASPIYDQIIKAWNRKSAGRRFTGLT
jgi:hypothetical protein